MGMPRNTIYEEIHKIIIKHPGIGVTELAFRIAREIPGYEFDSTSKLYDDIYETAHKYNIRHGSDKHGDTRYYDPGEAITLEIRCEGNVPRSNCYGCHFKQRVTDFTDVPYGQVSDDEARYLHFCALDPTFIFQCTMDMSNIMHNYCPINKVVSKEEKKS